MMNLVFPKLIVFLFIAINGPFVNCTKNQAFNERVDIYTKLEECDYYEYESIIKNYTEFVQINSLIDAQPTGYLIRFPVYVIGSKDALFCLSQSDQIDWEKDLAYEILIGGWSNSLIRKKINAYPISDVAKKNLLSVRRPTKFIIEITNGGRISVYQGNDSKPFMSAFDPNPIPIEYISFAAHQRDQMEFLYNCAADQNSAPPTLLESSDDIPLAEVDLSELGSKCTVIESWENVYDKFISLNDIKQQMNSDDDQIKLEMYIVGSKDAHILFTNDDKVNLTTDDAYEIVIGGYQNTRNFITRNLKEETLAQQELPNLLISDKQTKVVIQIGKNGKIEVYVGKSLYKPIIQASDPHPLSLKFVSFASNGGSRVLFFYNCIEKSELSEMPTTIHPLLVSEPVHDTNVLNKRCKVYDSWEFEYRDLFEMSTIKNNIQSDDFIIRLPVYIQGERDAHILLSSDKNTDNKNAYEIIIGGWGNTLSVINKNGNKLAEAFEYNVLNEQKPVKFIVEISKDGNLKIFSEYNKSRPLLHVDDPTPITDINYISFTAYYRDLKFFYDCIED